MLGEGPGQASADDWVAGHVFTYDRAALQRLSGAEFKIGSFIGEIVAADGGHELYGRIDAIKAGPLEYAVRTNTTWGTPATLPFRTITNPALAVHNGRLYLAYVRPEDQAVMWASMDAGGTWTQPAPIHGDQSWYGPALTSAGGTLHYAVTGKDSSVYTRTYTPQGWSSAYQQMPGMKRYSPALATWANQAWLVSYAYDNNLYHSRHNGTSWTGWAKDGLGWKLSTHVAMAPRDDRLWRIATGKDGRIYTSVNGGGTWAGKGVPDDRWRASHAPALANNGNTLTLLLRGSDSSLWSAEFNGSWAAGAHKVAGITMLETPAAVYFGGKLHMMYRRTAS
ncbi:hypothetical protein [Embleya sp. NPDC001921]